MGQIKFTAAALSIAIALTVSGPAAAAELNRGVYSVNQPVVQRTDYVIDLSAGAGVPDSELYRLAEWFESLGLGYGDRVFVDAGYDTERARQDVGRVVGEFGLLLSPGTLVTNSAVPSGSVRVVVRRAEATVPGCPNWADGQEINARISTSSNYGCSVNSNLAMMIADPNDLVLGQTRNGVTDPLETTRAITSYRRRPTTPFQALKSDKVGK